MNNDHNNPKYLNDYKETHVSYASMGMVGTIYLGYRDIPLLIQKHVLDKSSSGKIKVLDYGCGAGRSTRFIKGLRADFEVDGVDQNHLMLQQAKISDPNGNYLMTDAGKIPVKDHYYDFIFCSFVLFETRSKSDMKELFIEIKRVLKLGGIFIGVTGTTYLYDQKHQWVSYTANFPENLNPKTGDLVKLYIREADMVVNNTYWTEADYEEIFRSANINFIDKLHSTGSSSDGIQWKSETTHAPYVTYILGA